MSKSEQAGKKIGKKIGEAGATDAQIVRVLFADHLNLARGKLLSAAAVNRDGLNHTKVGQGLFGVTMDQRLIPAVGARVLEGVGDMQASFHGAEIRPGWLPHYHTVIADLLDTEGQPLPLDGRAALKRAIADWQALGYKPQLGIELEASIFEKSDQGKWVPYNCPGAYVYGTGPVVDPAGIMDSIFVAATDFGLQVEMITTEFNKGQMEMTLKYDEALAAVDAIFLLRVLAREVAAQKGLYLSFMPQPHPNYIGSGQHFNISFVDKKGTNVIGESGKVGLSPLAQRCTAGLVHHHKALGALLAPTVNSYQRLKPASLCGYWANWGIDHRGVAVRIPKDIGAKARLEHRLGDCTANPYSGAAALLQACRLGYEQQYALPPEETGNCMGTQDATVSVGANLGESLDALEQDTAFVQALGKELVAHFLDIKRDEVKVTANLSEQGLIDYYFPYI